MSYMDEQGGKDSASTKAKNHSYTVEEEQQGLTEQQTTEVKTAQKASKTAVESASQQSGPKGGILSRLRRTLFGDETAGSKAKRGFLSWKTSGGSGGAASPLVKILTKMGTPKVLAAIVMSSGLGIFSILGIFTTYKNDGVVRNDPPLQCEQGVIELPAVGEADEDQQKTVDVIYDTFHELGYSDAAIMGMLACMWCESTDLPDRLESDFLLKSEKEAFDGIAGPGTSPDSATAKEAYWNYGVAYQSGGGWNGNSFYIVDGHMCCGIGLIQWTAGRAIKLLDGLDIVNMGVSPMDIQYQTAFLLSEMMSDAYSAVGPDSDFKDMTDETEATKRFFFTMVSGGGMEWMVQDRIDALEKVRPLFAAKQANSEFRADITTMAELLADDSFVSAVAKSNKIQLCVNHTYVSTADIASAAVSISWLERGEYEDVHGAYGMYRRAARSPVMINDWNWLDGEDRVRGDLVTGVIRKGTYGNKGDGKPSVPSTDQRYSLPYYTNEGSTEKLDLIACTEYYYFAHLMAFPAEIGTDGGDGAGYFSSCDRGTATAVRIAGADDMFPPGNPLWQLQWAVGGAKINAQHNPDRRGQEGAGFLWQFAGFLRGCDYYSASGSASISPGTVMISWNVKAANGMLKEAMMGGATSGGIGDDGGVVPGAEADESGDDWDPEDDGSGSAEDTAKMKDANLRWPLAVTNSTRHIITFVGEGTVQKFWGMEWLYQQWTLFDDTDSLIRGDLTIEVPESMKKGLEFKGKTAKMVTDQKATFYEQEMAGAKTTDDVTNVDWTDRKMSFNAKTGLPTFHSWEQIFVRLIHNSDDDAAAKLAEDEDLYNEFSVDEDNYLDRSEDPDRIEQYQAWNTYSDKWFFEDWNSVGGGEVKEGGEDDYKGYTSYELPYKDIGEDKWTKAAVIDPKVNPFWRYELITDVEYRANQLLRFGMASFMCNLASEEDADIYQSGAEGNTPGHIVGNIYRRYARIPDETDMSGRYYFYNTVVSNDMLQDLVQLWSHERNGDKDGSQGGGGYDARNFGPMYLFGTVGEGMSGYSLLMKSQTEGFLDRRYGLSASDVNNIMNGLGGLSMGGDADATGESIGNMLANPMHHLSDAQLALYMRERKSDLTAYTDGRGAHESDHVYSENEWYADDVYGVNPFLMLESVNGLGRLNDIYTMLNPGLDKWTADEKGGSARILAGTPIKEGVDGNNPDEDDRLAWIDRHYVYGSNGNINMLAYQVAGLNPSIGYRRDNTAMTYEEWLKSVKTLEATATPETGNHAGEEEYADTLFSSWQKIRYTDFIYGEDTTNNQRMAKRLFGTDHRQDGEGLTTARDDYNRREYIVIPYYHTHAQTCDHEHLDGYDHYDLKCEWWGDDPGCSDADIEMIDTQTWLNTGTIAGGYSCPANTWWTVDGDQGDTISLDDRIQNRGKYNVEQLISWANANANVKYYTANGKEIDPNEKPRIHVTCDGWTTYPPCDGNCGLSGCGVEDDEGNVTCPCSPVKCHACGKELTCGDPPCVHPCESDCLPNNLCHPHKECDSQLHYSPDGTTICVCNDGVCVNHHEDHGSTTSGKAHYSGPSFAGQSDDCHDLYGCNILEFLYHNPDEIYKGAKVEAIYMVIPVVEKPIEKWADDTSGDIGIQDFMVGGKVVPDKANLLQQVHYNFSSGLVEKNWEAMTNDVPGALAHPDTSSMYMDNIDHVGDLAQWTQGMGVDYPVGSNQDGSWEGKTLFGIFTIEGNIIREKTGDDQCETIDNTDDNCTKTDFQRLESIRNRVGVGKSATYPVNGVDVTVSQKKSSATGSGLEWLEFDTDGYGENGFGSTGDYGYGEVKITGAQHRLDPTNAAGAYGWSAGGGAAGPDGRDGNGNNSFGNSLLREILGDEHVHHVRFGSQSEDGLTSDVDNGRDFQYFEEFKDLDDDKLYLDPYNNIPTDKEYYDELKRACTDEPTNDLGQPNKKNKKLLPSGANSATQITNDGGTPTVDGAMNSGAAGDGDYNLWVTHASRGTRGMMTQYLNFKGFFKDASSGPGADDGGWEYMYMLFNVIKRNGKDEQAEDHRTENQEPVESGEYALKTFGWKGRSDGDNDLNEDFAYSSSSVPPKAVDLSPRRVWGVGSVPIKDPDTGDIIGYKPANFSDTYGQGNNSHWKNLIDIYNAAMGETRHFD